MRLTRSTFVVAAVAMAATLTFEAYASDHADTPMIAANPGTDISDVFIFPSPADANNVVLVMNVHPLIPAGQGASVAFDTDVLYQFKIDNDGDFIEDLVIQATFEGGGASQKVVIHGPAAPLMAGTESKRLRPNLVSGAINTSFAPRAGIKAFAGVREDPFFIDLERFFAIFPDRATPITGTAVAEPNAPQLLSWRSPAEARDFVANFNVLSIVVELPKSELGGGVIGVWCTTSR